MSIGSGIALFVVVVVIYWCGKVKGHVQGYDKGYKKAKDERTVTVEGKLSRDDPDSFRANGTLYTLTGPDHYSHFLTIHN